MKNVIRLVLICRLFEWMREKLGVNDFIAECSNDQYLVVRGKSGFYLKERSQNSSNEWTINHLYYRGKAGIKGIHITKDIFFKKQFPPIQIYNNRFCSRISYIDIIFIFHLLQLAL